jgi:hypothetical protein
VRNWLTTSAERPSHIRSGPFDNLVDTRISNEESDYIGSHPLQIMPDFMFQDDLMHDSMFLANSVPDSEFLDNGISKNQTVWLTPTSIRFWSIDDPDTFSTILSSIWSDTIVASERQRHMMTDQLPIYEKKAWFDLEHGVNLGDRESQTGTGDEKIAASRSYYEALMFLLLSSASATVATLWNDANNKTIVRSGHRVGGTGKHKSVRNSMVETVARN